MKNPEKIWVTSTPLFKTLLLFSLCTISISLSLLIGDIHLTAKDLWLLLGGKGSTLQEYIFFHLRLTHTLNTFVIGCLLALSGYLMQVLLANPLADPYTLGTSGGSAVFTLLGILCGIDGFYLIGCGFMGSLVSLLLLALLSGNLKNASSLQLSLIGVVLAAGWGAILNLLLILSPTAQTKSILYWLFGDVDSQQFPIFASISLIVGFVISLIFQNDLKILSQGQLLAKTLGVDTERLQRNLIILSALLTASAVSIGGTIGFIGLIVPHLSRMLFKTTHLSHLFCTLILGGTLLIAADIFARTLISPAELPIGLLTTLLGIPFFLFLSARRHV